MLFVRCGVVLGTIGVLAAQPVGQLPTGLAQNRFLPVWISPEW